MAQVKIYALKGMSPERMRMISDAIHGALVQALGLPESKKFQRFILMDRECFIYPADRSENYTIVELLMFEGRSAGTKKELIRLIYSRAKELAGIDPVDMEIVIIESPRANWGIRGLPGDELEVGYRVDL
ncbi:MAG: tautomerase family protein [Thermodesulfovibrionales bacterium]|nr:tautomerase family protein [Thermodesulfovibrionales bacterium]